MFIRTRHQEFLKHRYVGGWVGGVGVWGTLLLLYIAHGYDTKMPVSAGTECKHTKETEEITDGNTTN